jgi:hypothetical protein
LQPPPGRPAVRLRTIGADRHALEVVEGLWNVGSSAEGLSLYEPVAGEFAKILDIATAADDCGQHEKCFKYESTIAYEASSQNAFDIALAFKGTYRNRAGRIAKVPAAPIVQLLVGQRDGLWADLSPIRLNITSVNMRHSLDEIPRPPS